MNSLLAVFEVLEKEKSILISEINTVNKELLFKKPSESKWSIAQILEHVRVAEKQTLKIIQKNLISRTDFIDATLQHALYNWIARVVFKLRIPQKAPSFVSNIPLTPDVAHLLEDWASTRTEMRAIIENFSLEMEDKIVFKHPVVGYMTLLHVLKFELAHFYVHAGQVRRLL